jgi:hypothetical protein
VTLVCGFGNRLDTPLAFVLYSARQKEGPISTLQSVPDAGDRIGLVALRSFEEEHHEGHDTRLGEDGNHGTPL